MTTDSSTPRYAFCGNRAFVLEAMRGAGLAVAVSVIANSYAEKFCREKNIPHVVIHNKHELLHWLGSLTCDIFIANGCPYKIPVAQFPHVRCVNIHPSYLPDLRGADPVPGAILFARDSGATCHLMDDGFDTGSIIAQTRLPYSHEWDALMLYPLSFNAEVAAFTDALKRGFAPLHPQIMTGDEIYYSFKPQDLAIDTQDDAHAIIRRVRAFNTPNKLARLLWQGNEIKITHAEIVPIDYIPMKNEIVLPKKGGKLRLEIAKP
jgi:methionyl-tRNA formyltransferase